MHGGLREGAGRKAVEDKNKEISTHINSVQNYNYCWQLWNQTSRGKLVRNAALDAANKITEYCSIRFRGNRSYDGGDELCFGHQLPF